MTTPTPGALALTAAASRRAAAPCRRCGEPQAVVTDAVTLPGFGGSRIFPCKCKEKKRDE